MKIEIPEKLLKRIHKVVGPEDAPKTPEDVTNFVCDILEEWIQSWEELE